MTRSHKVRIYPTVLQNEALKHGCGVARFCYNWGLERWNEHYRLTGTAIGAYRLGTQFNAIKRVEFPWALNVSNRIPRNAFSDLERGFQGYFKGAKERPSFKKKGGKNAFRVEAGSGARMYGATVLVPRVGRIRCAESLRWPTAQLLSVTIKATADRWYAIVAVELPEGDTKNCGCENQAPRSVGIDLGFSSFATLSTGEKIEHPRFLRRALPKLRRLNQALMRKRIGSNNWTKAKLAVVRKRVGVGNSHDAFIHRVTADIARRFDHIAIENLHVGAMRKVRALARSAEESSFGKFRAIMKYKGRHVTVCDRFFPSTRLCSRCGTKTALGMSIKSWTCESCGVSHDRDINAAINLLGQINPSAAISAAAACGDLGMGRSLKQEAGPQQNGLRLANTEVDLHGNG